MGLEKNLMNKENRRCQDCKFFMTIDIGYSNYTVEETTVHCLKKLNKYFPCQESYSWKYENSPDHKQLQVAITCKKFKNGNGMKFDVDGEVNLNTYSNDQELVNAYIKYNGYKHKDFPLCSVCGVMTSKDEFYDERPNQGHKCTVCGQLMCEYHIDWNLSSRKTDSFICTECAKERSKHG